MQQEIISYLSDIRLQKSKMQLNIVLLALFATVAAALAQGHHEGGQEAQGDHQAAYNFEYGVHDPHTHDFHSQKEHREGKNVVGEYTIKEADGTQRIVKYVAGPHSGFEAIVERVGHAQHPAHYGKHGKGKEGEVGGTSYVEVTHWRNQGYEHGH